MNIKIIKQDGKIFSVDHPTRAIVEVLFGYALYLKAENGFGMHVGIADDKGAWDWLNGEELKDIKHYRVFDIKMDHAGTSPFHVK